MKKIIICTVLLSFLTQSAWAIKESKITPPDWSEFCPWGWTASEYKQPNCYSNLKIITYCFSIVGLPFAVKNLETCNNQINENYWAQRRYAFKQNILTCQRNTRTNQKLAECYETVKSNEMRLNINKGIIQALNKPINIQLDNNVTIDEDTD